MSVVDDEEQQGRPSMGTPRYLQQVMLLEELRKWHKESLLLDPLMLVWTV